jgi:hypothetical protein
MCERLAQICCGSSVAILALNAVVVAGSSMPVMERLHPGCGVRWSAKAANVRFGPDAFGARYTWVCTCKPDANDAQGQGAEFLASAFPYDAKRDRFTCPVGKDHPSPLGVFEFPYTAVGPSRWVPRSSAPSLLAR